MATPLGHSLAGYIISRLPGRTQTPDRVSRLLLCICMANAADVDFLPGILMGSPAMYHQGITHSLGFMLLVSLGVSAVCRLWGKSFVTIFSLSSMAYLSHLAMDFLGTDTRPPYGIPLFWPISDAHFMSPVPLFWGVRHAGTTATSTLEWFGALFHSYNLAAIALEIGILLPFALVGQWRRGVLQSRQGPA
jgi:inner membrane protein